MNIPIILEPDALQQGGCEAENCIFCNNPTHYWHEYVNRPICAVCSVMYTIDQIPKAPYNY